MALTTPFVPSLSLSLSVTFELPHSAFLVPMARPRSRNTRRSLSLGALLEGNGPQSLVTARWRHGMHRPAAGVRGSQRAPLSLPTRDVVPLSTLDRHGSAFRCEFFRFSVGLSCRSVVIWSPCCRCC